MSGARRPSAERPLVPDACATSRVYQDASRTVSGTHRFQSQQEEILKRLSSLQGKHHRRQAGQEDDIRGINPFLTTHEETGPVVLVVLSVAYAFLLHDISLYTLPARPLSLSLHCKNTCAMLCPCLSTGLSNSEL